jgi:hypothetical protein
MKTVTISDDAARFIINFVNQIETQDNRSTASPYFYVVRGIKKLTAADDRGCGYEYYDSELCESFTEDELKKYCEENELDFELHSEELERINVQEVEVDENVFFTFEGYKKHINMNGHNYRHFERFNSYVKHAFRNPEIENLLKTIKEIGCALKKKETGEHQPTATGQNLQS